MIADLTEEAAKEDSIQLVEEIVLWLSRVISHLVYNHPIKEQVAEPAFKSQLIEKVAQNINTLYAYITSEYTNPPDEDKCYQAGGSNLSLTIILFSSLTHNMAFDRLHEEFDILKGSMPRLAFAIKLARTRLKLDFQVLSDKKNDEAITVQELADLADVTYMAIKKQLNVKIRAQRKGNTWAIPVEEALKYLKERKSKS